MWTQCNMRGAVETEAPPFSCASGTGGSRCRTGCWWLGTPPPTRWRRRRSPWRRAALGWRTGRGRPRPSEPRWPGPPPPCPRIPRRPQAPRRVAGRSGGPARGSPLGSPQQTPMRSHLEKHWKTISTQVSLNGVLDRIRLTGHEKVTHNVQKSKYISGFTYLWCYSCGCHLSLCKVS